MRPERDRVDNISIAAELSTQEANDPAVAG